MTMAPRVSSGAQPGRRPGRTTGRWAGLTGYRYLLAVAVLVALTTVPMLVAVMAGAATLSQPVPPAGDATPFVIYPPPPAVECPSWPERPQ